MSTPMTRRTILGRALLIPLAGQLETAARALSAGGVQQSLADLEERYDARLGLYAIDTGTRRSVAHRADERFPFCSTCKALMAASLMRHRTIAELEERVRFTRADLIANSPISEKHLDSGMTLREVCAAAIRYSDNTAGNILFDRLGGPAGFQRELRAIGDRVTRSDRIEAALSTCTPHDPRDTSTPRALAADFRAFALGRLLADDRRRLLRQWLLTNTTGDHTIRAGVPKGWKVGDKTGSGLGYGARNDIAILWPPRRAPIVVSILSTRPRRDDASRDALLADATRAVLPALR